MGGRNVWEFLISPADYALLYHDLHENGVYKKDCNFRPLFSFGYIQQNNGNEQFILSECSSFTQCQLQVSFLINKRVKTKTLIETWKKIMQCDFCKYLTMHKKIAVASNHLKLPWVTFGVLMFVLKASGTKIDRRCIHIWKKISHQYDLGIEYMLRFWMKLLE